MKIFILIIIFIAVTNCFAEVLILKSGKNIECKIIERAENEIKIDMGIGIPISYYLSEIDKIVTQDGKTEEINPASIFQPDISSENLCLQKNQEQSGYMTYFNVKYDLAEINPGDDYRPTQLIMAVNELEKYGISVKGVKVISEYDTMGNPIELKLTTDGKYVLFVRRDMVESTIKRILWELNIKEGPTQEDVEREKMIQNRKEILDSVYDVKDDKDSGFIGKIARTQSTIIGNLGDTMDQKVSITKKINVRNTYKSFDEIFSAKKSNYDDKKNIVEVENENSSDSMAIVHYNQAYSFAEKGMLDEAINEYSKSIELNPYFASAFNNRGFTFYEKGDIKSAISDYNKAIEIDSMFSSAYYNLGSAYADLNNLKNAIQNYSKAIEIDSSFASAYYNRGSAYRQLKEYEKAISDYTTAIRLDPYFAIGYYNRGYVYSDIGDFENAIYDYTKAIQLDNTFVNAHYNRGTIYLNRGELNKALNDFNTALNIDPNYSFGYYIRGCAYAEKGDYNKTIENYNKAIELDPNNPDFYRDRAIIQFSLKNIKQCQEDVKRAQNMGIVFSNEFLSALKNYTK